LRTLSVILLFAAAAPAQTPVRESIVVTGTWDPLALEEMDRSVALIPAREQSIVVNTLADLLQLDSSLDLRRRAPDGIQGDLSIRGGSFGQTLVLVNGQRMNDAQSGRHNLDVPLPLESVERIEVMRGAGSTLYGSDAVGGVVNIATSPAKRAVL
jgi:iron complex outermembrane receptor protein